MPKYAYTAKSQPQKSIQGEIEAESEQDAINKLNRLGYFPTSIQPQTVSLAKSRILNFPKISSRDIVLFTRQLSTLIESDVNIISSLNTISTQINNKYLQAVLADLLNKIRDGKSLSDSLAAYPYLFSNLYTAMIRAGEVGGNLEQVLNRLADFLEKEEEFRNSVRAALTYPFFIVAVGILTIAILLGFVIPRLVTMFEDMSQILPLPTRILIALSGFFQVYWWLIVALVAIAVFVLRRLYRYPQGRLLWDSFRLKVIILGNIVLKTEISRLTHTLSLLLSNGIPIFYSLDISTSAIGNQVLKQELQKFKEQIRAGLSFSQCLKDSKLFPAFVTNIVLIGEKSGTLEKSLLRISSDYEREVERILKAFTRLLEPVIMLIMGLVVGVIVLSMLLPIFQINLIVK